MCEDGLPKSATLDAIVECSYFPCAQSLQENFVRIVLYIPPNYRSTENTV